ncbi:MAG: TolB family protein [Terriglobia bacterium]
MRLTGDICDSAGSFPMGPGHEQAVEAVAVRDAVPVWRPAWADEPRWSPDGTTLRFTVGDVTTETSSLWEVGTDGSKPHRLLPAWHDPPQEIAGGWIRDGAYFLFTSRRNDKWEIWALREKCGLRRLACGEPILVDAGLGDYSPPVPSRDGKQLFVMAQESQDLLERYDLKSDKFVPYLPGIPATELDFSRDGQWLAYVKLPDSRLWQSRADGSERLQLTFPGEFDRADEPHWSPDGKQIAFMGVRGGNHFKAYVIPAGGGAPHALVPGNGEEGVATWSRDGRRLFWGERLHVRPPPEMTIHELDLKTYRLSELPGSNGLWTARCSPDGRYIAAVAVAAEYATEYSNAKFRPQGLLLFERATLKWRYLSNLKGIHEPTWSHDSRFIYFDTLNFDTLNPQSALYRVRVADGVVEPLADLKGDRWWEDGWSGVTPDGSPLITRRTVFSEIYALDVEWP